MSTVYCLLSGGEEHFYYWKCWINTGYFIKKHIRTYILGCDVHNTLDIITGWNIKTKCQAVTSFCRYTESPLTVWFLFQTAVSAPFNLVELVGEVAAVASCLHHCWLNECVVGSILVEEHLCVLPVWLRSLSPSTPPKKEPLSIKYLRSLS